MKISARISLKLFSLMFIDALNSLAGPPLQWTTQSNFSGNDATATKSFTPPTPIILSSAKIMQSF